MKLDTLETFLKLLKKRTDEGKIVWEDTLRFMCIGGDLFSTYVFEISTIKMLINVRNNWSSITFRELLHYCIFINGFEYSTEEHRRFALKKTNRKYWISNPLSLDETLIPSLYESVKKSCKEIYKKKRQEDELKLEKEMCNVIDSLEKMG